MLGKKYLSLNKYISKIIFIFNKYSSPYIESIVGVKSECLSTHPPIFFLGAPRSGSTLAIQVITDSFDIGYMSNKHCKWFGAPFLVGKLKKTVKGRSNYNSEYGITFGDSESSECGEWWYRFFRRKPAYVALNDVDQNKMIFFRRSISLLTQACNKSMLFKNMYASLRIKAIAYYIPEAIFIITHRNEVENGHSLLEVRKNIFGGYEEWWSIEPPGIETLKQLPVHQQVIEQIRETHKTINDDLDSSGVNKDKIFYIDYERLCDNPVKVVSNLQQFFKLNGCAVERKKYNPSPFERRKDIRIDKKLYDAMKKYAEGV